jgi:para-aminobenzoate synthetase component 1
MDAGAPLPFDVIPVPTPPGGPMAVELVPAPDPWEVARRLAHLSHLLFLDSAEKHPDRGRYSYVAADTSLSVHHSARLGRKRNKNTLRVIKEDFAPLQMTPIPGLPPFQGGIGFLFGYELGRAFETLPQARFDEFESPEWAFAQYDWVVRSPNEPSMDRFDRMPIWA